MTAATAWVPRLPYEGTHTIEQVEILADLFDGHRHYKHVLGLYDLTIYVKEDDAGDLNFEPEIAYREVRTGETGTVEYRRYRAGDPRTWGLMFTDYVSAAVDGAWPSIERECVAIVRGW